MSRAAGKPRAIMLTSTAAARAVARPAHPGRGTPFAIGPNVIDHGALPSAQQERK